MTSLLLNPRSYFTSNHHKCVCQPKINCNMGRWFLHIVRLLHMVTQNNYLLLQTKETYNIAHFEKACFNITYYITYYFTFHVSWDCNIKGPCSCNLYLQWRVKIISISKLSISLSVPPGIPSHSIIVSVLAAGCLSCLGESHNSHK